MCAKYFGLKPVKYLYFDQRLSSKYQTSDFALIYLVDVFMSTNHDDWMTDFIALKKYIFLHSKHPLSSSIGNKKLKIKHITVNGTTYTPHTKY